MDNEDKGIYAVFYAMIALGFFVIACIVAIYYGLAYASLFAAFLLTVLGFFLLMVN